MAALELFYGDAYRTAAAEPIRRIEPIPAARGRILARDGTVLAYDRQLSALAIQYRRLEQPPQPRWLESEARRRLPARRKARLRENRDRETKAAGRREAMHVRLAVLCGLTPEAFRARMAVIQTRVERVASSVNDRRRRQYDARRAAAGSARANAPPDGEAWLSRARGDLRHCSSPRKTRRPIRRSRWPRSTTTTSSAKTCRWKPWPKSSAHPDRYPGVRIVDRRRRVYPSDSLAAHVLGHLGPAEAKTDAQHAGALAGQLGIERQFEPLLAGRDGRLVELRNPAGQTISTTREQEPRAGRDLMLSIDQALQHTAETLLDQTLARLRPRIARGGRRHRGHDRRHRRSAGFGRGAAVRSQRLRRARFARGATTPRRPRASAFRSIDSDGDSARLDLQGVVGDRALGKRRHDAGGRILLPGYLHEPTRQRCMIYRRRQRGHEQITLRDALAQSCNVYFFHFAEQTGAAPLVAWAEKFGFGAATGIELPGESPGQLPTPESARMHGQPWRAGDTLALAVGQGSLTATPLQMARLFAAIANGGKLVTPRIALRLGMSADQADSAEAGDDAPHLQLAPPQSIAGLHGETLAAVRRGLEQVVAASDGTAHRTVYNESVTVAGKTGTAETGRGREDHAWFAGYAPAEAPVVAFVIALEHAGGGGEAAGPIARRLVQKLDSLGYFRRVRMANAARSPD